MSGYNGWANYDTWNVALWISNDEPLYREAVDFMKTYAGKNPYADFIMSLRLAGRKTHDNVRWMSADLDYVELNEFMREFTPLD